MTDGWGISCELALRWMSLDLTDDKSTLVKVIVWCHQATRHYLSQWWPRCLSSYGIIRPQWVNSLWSNEVISKYRSGTTLLQVMACCLMASSHYLNQCCLKCQQVLVAFTRGQLLRKCSRYLSQIWDWKLLNQDYSHISQGSMRWYGQSEAQRSSVGPMLVIWPTRTIV